MRRRNCMLCDKCGEDPCSCVIPSSGPSRFEPNRAIDPIAWQAWFNAYGKPRKGDEIHTQTCSTQGCTSVVRYRLGTVTYPIICKWCREGRTSHLRARPPIKPDPGPFITKEEFGLTLFEAIKTNAARLQALRQNQQKDAIALEAKLKELLTHIQNPDDVRRILAM